MSTYIYNSDWGEPTSYSGTWSDPTYANATDAGKDGRYTGNTGEMLSGQDVDANTFNAQQAAIARQYDEYMSSTAYQRATEDMQAAGLNPAMMYAGSGGAASTPTSPTSSASSGNNGVSFMNSILDTLMGLGDLGLRASTTKATIDNIKADTENKKADTEGKTIDNKYNKDTLEKRIAYLEEQISALRESKNLTIQKINESKKYVEQMESAIEVNGSIIKKNEADAELAFYEAYIKSIDAEMEQKMLDAEYALKKAYEQYYKASAGKNDQEVEVLQKKIEQMEYENQKLQAETFLDVIMQGKISAEQMKILSEKYGIDLENFVKEKNKNWQVWGQRAQVVGEFLQLFNIAADTKEKKSSTFKNFMEGVTSILDVLPIKGKK